MKITRFQAENVKRLSVVEITPDGNLVIVGGRNGQGKSSVLDSIMYALAGKKSIPSQPLRKGQKNGKVVIELDGDAPPHIHPPLIVTRTFAEGKPTQLEITTKDGYQAPSPQTILDEICGRIAFDPLSFTRLKPKEQADMLRELVGLDFTDLDRDHKRAFDERTNVNRDGKALKARFDGLEHFPDAPFEEVSVSELSEEQKRREQVNAANAGQRSRLALFDAQIAGQEKSERELEAEIARLMARLEESKSKRAGLLIDREALMADLEKLVDEDIDEVRQKIISAGEVNRQVQANAARSQLEDELKRLRERSESLTKTLKEIDEAKSKAMAEAKWPVTGLGFNEDGVTFAGLPFEQASSAEQLRVSVAMGVAMNPTLRVWQIRDGSLLDTDSLALVAQMAEQHDAQVWIERVSDGAECSVIIEDGTVVHELETAGT